MFDGAPRLGAGGELSVETAPRGTWPGELAGAGRVRLGVAATLPVEALAIPALRPVGLSGISLARSGRDDVGAPPGEEATRGRALAAAGRVVTCSAPSGARGGSISAVPWDDCSGSIGATAALAAGISECSVRAALTIDDRERSSVVGLPFGPRRGAATGAARKERPAIRQAIIPVPRKNKKLPTPMIRRERTRARTRLARNAGITYVGTL